MRNKSGEIRSKPKMNQSFLKCLILNLDLFLKATIWKPSFLKTEIPFYLFVQKPTEHSMFSLKSLVFLRVLLSSQNKE